MTNLLICEIKALMDQGMTLDQIFAGEAAQKAVKEEQAAIESEEERNPMWKKDYNPMLEKETIDNMVIDG